MLQQATEILSDRIALIVAFLGGIIGMALGNIGEWLAANATGAISLTALAMNWYYNRRREQREARREARELEAADGGES